jgi:hypothetical protein
MALSHANPTKTSSTGGSSAPAGLAPTVRPAVAAGAEGPEPDLAGNAAQVEEAGLGPEPAQDLTREQAGATEPAAPTAFRDHDAALAHNKKVKACFGAVLDQAIAAGVDPAKGAYDEANLLHNSAEWIQSGNATVHILTPTHDAAQRGAGGKLAFFDKTRNWNELDSDYPAEKGVRNDPRLSMHDPGAHGAMNEGGTDLTMINPVAKDEIRHTLIHEVQHDADQTWSGQAWEQKGKGWDKEKTANVNGYQSEFRAYWIMDAAQFPPATQKAKNQPPASYAEAMGIKSTSFKNARQEAIFWNMVQYDSYNRYLWAYVEDAEFRKMVHDFAVPVSGNVINSVRIQSLSEKLTACSKASALDGKEVVATLAAAGQLDGLDRAFLGDATQSAPFWAQARRQLSDEALDALKAAVA